MADTSQTTPDARVEDRIRQDRPDHPTTLDDAAMRQARNSAAFWAATGTSRGHEVIHRRSFLAVLGGKRAGTRILLQEPDPDAHELAELTELVGRSTGPVDAEDPFSSTDLSHLGMRNWQMPIMLRPPGPVSAPAMEVIRVRHARLTRAHGAPAGDTHRLTARTATVRVAGLHRRHPIDMVVLTVTVAQTRGAAHGQTALSVIRGRRPTSGHGSTSAWLRHRSRAAAGR